MGRRGSGGLNLVRENNNSGANGNEGRRLSIEKITKEKNEFPRKKRRRGRTARLLAKQKARPETVHGLGYAPSGHENGCNLE